MSDRPDDERVAADVDRETEVVGEFGVRRDELRYDVGTLFNDQTAWTRKAIYNVARIGKFSSDRTIREYAADIWGMAEVNASLRA